MPTRRQFLLAAAAGGLAPLIEGCASLPSGPPTARRAAFRYSSGRMASAHMRRPVGWTVAYPLTPPTGVAYCLHGKGNDHRFPFEVVRLPDAASAAGAAIAIAAVDGGADSYWHPRADGTDAMAMLLDEFIPMVDRGLPPRTRRAIVGWSMGGYGALLAAERARAMFVAVVAVSPALWTSPGSSAPGAFDGAEDYRRFDVFAGVGDLAGLTIRVDCGTGDAFYPSARRFVAGLPPGWEGGFEPGAHDPTYWNRVAPAEMATLGRAFGRG